MSHARTSSEGFRVKGCRFRVEALGFFGCGTGGLPSKRGPVCQIDLPIP